MSMAFVLKDVNGEKPFPANNVIRGAIRNDPHGRFLILTIDGYGEKNAKDGCGEPILLENLDGKLRVVLWSDINKEDPTYIVEMEGARESARIEE